MTAPDERSFVVFNRGVVRDQIILASFRNDLRSLTDPETGVAFTEDDIQRATQPGTRFYIEADSIDLFGQAQQQRALFFVSQIDPRRANTTFLEEQHGRIWLGPDSRLPATGASGSVLGTGAPGTIIPGSTTIGDPAAAIAVDPNGAQFQVLVTVIIGANRQAQLTLRGIDVGFATNLSPGTILTWSTGVNPGTDPEASVAAQFDGGFDIETDTDYATRIIQRIRNRPASGNAFHFQAWAQQSSNAIEGAFVYPTALNAGSVLVAIVEKRNTDIVPPEGPNARVPSAGTLITATNFLVAPASPVVPQRVFVVVSSIVPQQANMVVQLSMALGSPGGWADVLPWPDFSLNFPEVQATVITSDVEFEVETDVSLPNGVASLAGPDAPLLMVFNREISRFIQLDVASITVVGTTATIVLNTPPQLFDADGLSRDIVVGDRISPFTDRLDVVAEATETYFDSLGPGEVVADSDLRFARAARQPRPSNQSPIRAGQAILSVLLDALAGSAVDAELTRISRNDPDLPTNIVDGPNIVTFGDLNIYPL